MSEGSLHKDQSKNPYNVSAEYNGMRENFFREDNIDRSKWMDNLFANYPDIKKFQQQVMPVDRAIEFGNLYLPDERMINQEILFSLISQHFHTLGLLNSQQVLHQEWDGKFDFPNSLDLSQLALLIQRGIQNSENFWMLTTPGTIPRNETEDKTNQKVIEEFEKIIGKEVHSKFVIKDESPLTLEKPEDPNKFILDRNNQLAQTTINQIIWIYTTNSKCQSKRLVKAACLLSSSLIKNPRIMFSKILERFRIAVKSETIMYYSKKSEIKKSFSDTSLISKMKKENTESNESEHDSTSKDEDVASNSHCQIQFLLNETANSENTTVKSDTNENLANGEANSGKTVSSLPLITTETSSLIPQFNQIKNTLSVLSIWIDQCGPQISPAILSSVISFLSQEVPVEFDKKVKKIQFKIGRILNPSIDSEINNENDDQSPRQPPPKVELDSHHMPWSLHFELTNLPPIEFARQITVFISQFFYQIKGCELVYSSDDEIEFHQPNLNGLITYGNDFFRWIQFCVLSKSEVNERASLLSYFVEVARKLYKMQNFYGCSLILNTFDNSFAFLRATKALMTKNDLNFIEEAKSAIVNFSADSTAVQQFFRESLKKMPTIPVIFPYKSSIQSAIKGRLVAGDKVNVPVLMEIFNLVCEFEEFQKKKYNFYAIDQAQELLSKCNSPKSLNELIDYAKKLEWN